MDDAPDESSPANARASVEASGRGATGIDDAVAARDSATGRVESETSNAQGQAEAATDVQGHIDAQAEPLTSAAASTEASVRAQAKPVDDAQARVDDGRARVDEGRGRVDSGVSFAEEAQARPVATGAAVAADSVAATHGIRSQQDVTDRATSEAVDRAEAAADIQGTVDAEVSVTDPTAQGETLKPR